MTKEIPMDHELRLFAEDMICFSDYCGQSVEQSLEDANDEIPPQLTKLEILVAAERIKKESKWV